MFWEYTEVYDTTKNNYVYHLKKIPHQRGRKNPPPCHTNVPMIYNQAYQLLVVFMINNMSEK